MLDMFFLLVGLVAEISGLGGGDTTKSIYQVACLVVILSRQVSGFVISGA